MNLSKYDVLSKTKVSFRLHFNLDEDKRETAKHPSGCELVTDDFMDCVEVPPTIYSTSKIMLAGALNYIKKHGSTDKNCSAEIHITMNPEVCPVYRMNVCKFILSFDEDAAYNLFPERKNIVGAMSIKRALDVCDVPDGMSLYDRCGDKNVLSDNMYGIDLSQMDLNTIIIKYAGGKNYEDKYMELSTLVDHYITNIYSIVSEPAYSVSEIDELRDITERRKRFNDAFMDYDSFMKVYEKAKLFVDLYDLKGMESVYWSMIKDKVRDIMMQVQADKDTNITINYDTDCSAFQIKNCEIKNAAGLTGVDILDCEVSGNISSCAMYTCDIKDAVLKFCSCFSNCHIDDSYVSDTYLSDGTKCTNCRIFGDSTISGTYEKCRIAGGVKYMKNTKFKHTDKSNAVEI